MKTIILTRMVRFTSTLLICLFSVGLHAQTFEEENTKALDRMDVSGLKEKVVLNKAIALLSIPFNKLIIVTHLLIANTLLYLVQYQQKIKTKTDKP